MSNCNPKRIAQFLSGKLDLDETLSFLYHLDDCPRCWEELYHARRAQHPHYYKKKSRRMAISEREIAQLKKDEEVIEVA